MSNLFVKIPKGSILLWHVKNDDELPKRKEMTRLLGTDTFIYYKCAGHHRDYIRLLGRLMDSLNPSTDHNWISYWPKTAMSHFLFTAQEIEINSFFLLKYSNQCLGSFHVNNEDLEVLDEHLRHYDHVRRLTRQVNDWPKMIQNHKDEIRAGNIADEVIENLDIARLQDFTKGYGQQAIDNAIANLQAWHDQFSWKSKSSG